MLIRDVTWQEIDNAADLPLVGGYRVLTSWHCTAAADRPCLTGKSKTGCGKRHLHWDTPRMSDGEATGWSARGDRLGVTLARTLIGAATGSITPLHLPGRQDRRDGRFMWVPAEDKETWASHPETWAPAQDDEPDADENEELRYSGHDADDTCRFGEVTWRPSAPLPRRGISSVALSLTVDEPTLPAVPRQRATTVENPRPSQRLRWLCYRRSGLSTGATLPASFPSPDRVGTATNPPASSTTPEPLATKSVPRHSPGRTGAPVRPHLTHRKPLSDGVTLTVTRHRRSAHSHTTASTSPLLHGWLEQVHGLSWACRRAPSPLTGSGSLGRAATR